MSTFGRWHPEEMRAALNGAERRALRKLPEHSSCYAALFDLGLIRRTDEGWERTAYGDAVNDAPNPARTNADGSIDYANPRKGGRP